MQSQRWAWTHTYAVPLFVTSLVALLLAGAGWAAVLVFEHGAGDPGDSAQSSADPSDDQSGTDPVGGDLGGGDRSNGSPGPSDADPGEIDDCVVGVWEVLEHTETLAVDATLSGTFTLVGGTPVIEYRADGSALSDYHDGSQFEIAVGFGDPVSALVTGQVHYRYEVSDGTIRYFDIESDAVFSLDLLGTSLDQEFSYRDSPFQYECVGDTMTFHNPEQEFQARLQRR